MTRELEAIRKDAAEPDVAPDDVLETYIEKKDVSLTEARRKAASLEERRAVEDITRDVLKVEAELRRFNVDLVAAPNLDELRRGLVKLIETAQNLEVKIVAARAGATA